MINHSSPVGSTNWLQGDNTAFNAQAGPPTSYAAANFHNADAVGTISDWLITPDLTFNNGGVLYFCTRTARSTGFPDRLEVRFNPLGGTNVGTTATDVGDFTTLLLTVNPALTTSGYPSDWTELSATISGLSGAATGSLAFRYFVTNGGPKVRMPTTSVSTQLQWRRPPPNQPPSLFSASASRV